MFSKELWSLLPQVITSWQVIAITVALVVYMFLVSYVARTYHRPLSVSRTKPQKATAEKRAMPWSKFKKDKKPQEKSGAESSNDELGITEE